MSPQAILESWIDEQSPAIQDLVKRFPPGSRIIDSTAREYFVCGYFEDGSLGISNIPPDKDLAAALDSSWIVNKESVDKFRPIGNG